MTIKREKKKAQKEIKYAHVQPLEWASMGKIYKNRDKCAKRVIVAQNGNCIFLCIRKVRICEKTIKDNVKHWEL